MLPLILGSSSIPRARLLNQLALPYCIVAPHIDEKRLPQESVEKMVVRLARGKAEAVAAAHPNALIIGSDQVLSVSHQILGKPMTQANAREQLALMSGKQGTFHSALCLYNSQTQKAQITTIPTHIQFRTLSRATIDYYLEQESPLHCAGSLKAEGLGVILCQHIRSEDPYAIQGLPLTTLVSMLLNENYPLIQPSANHIEHQSK